MPATYQEQLQFIFEVYPFALEVQDSVGIPARAMLMQAAHESGWGKSALAQGGNNLFGVKGEGPAGSGMYRTQEDYGNGLETIRDRFAHYNSPEESMAEHVNFLTNERYSPALERFGYVNGREGDWKNYIAGIRDAGYATRRRNDYVGDMQAIEIRHYELLNAMDEMHEMGIPLSPEQAERMGLASGAQYEMQYTTVERFRAAFDLPNALNFLPEPPSRAYTYDSPSGASPLYYENMTALRESYNEAMGEVSPRAIEHLETALDFANGGSRFNPFDNSPRLIPRELEQNIRRYMDKIDEDGRMEEVDGMILARHIRDMAGQIRGELHPEDYRVIVQTAEHFDELYEAPYWDTQMLLDIADTAEERGVLIGECDRPDTSYYVGSEVLDPGRAGQERIDRLPAFGQALAYEAWAAQDIVTAPGEAPPRDIVEEIGSALDSIRIDECTSPDAPPTINITHTPDNGPSR